MPAEPRSYYNEIDPHAAAWLRELIRDGLVAPGDVDERSIADVEPADVRGYTQCHWFAGIGGWSHALRLAQWDDARPVWTGSCPCQPFSVAGKRQGVTDVRHLWPEWFRLIGECRPATIVGEQVAGRAGLAWFDGVAADLEGCGYAVGAAVVPAGAAGSPHRRERLWFVADHNGVRREVEWCAEIPDTGPDQNDADGCRDTGPVGNTQRPRLEGHAGDGRDRHEPGRDGTQSARPVAEAGSAGAGFWSGAVPIRCSDGKSRLAQPGIFPLAHGLPARLVRGSDPGVSVDPDSSQEGRVMRLRGYGNAIVPQVAEEFVRAYMDHEGCHGR